MPDNCCCKPKKRIFIGGPFYNNAQKTELTKIAVMLERNGYCTFLPQRDGLELDKVVNTLVNEGRTVEEAQNEAVSLIFNHNIFNLLRSVAYIADINGTSIDEGTVSLASIAFSSCMPIVLYRNDSRTFANNAEVNPILSGLKSVPIVRRIRDIPSALQTAIPKRECKCISDSVKDAMREGASINRGRFR